MSDLTNGLRYALEQVLSSSRHTTDSGQLFKLAEIRAHTKSAHRVSDCLAMLWREGQLTRLPPATSSEFGGRTCWSYRWKSTSLPFVCSDSEQESLQLGGSLLAAGDISKPVERERPKGKGHAEQKSTWERYVASLKAESEIHTTRSDARVIRNGNRTATIN